LFTKNRNLNGFIKPTLFGSELELQNQVKDQVKLNFYAIVLWQCQRAIGKTWGLRPKVEILRSVLTYAAVMEKDDTIKCQSQNWPDAAPGLHLGGTS
jgi:hypothetical protein